MILLFLLVLLIVDLLIKTLCYGWHRSMIFLSKIKSGFFHFIFSNLQLIILVSHIHLHFLFILYIVMNRFKFDIFSIHNNIWFFLKNRLRVFNIIYH